MFNRGTTFPTGFLTAETQHVGAIPVRYLGVAHLGKNLLLSAACHSSGEKATGSGNLFSWPIFVSVQKSS